MKVAIYARYCSDEQSAASIQDQLRICREQAVRDGFRVVTVYKNEIASPSKEAGR